MLKPTKPIQNNIDHFYVFFLDNKSKDIPVYDRTCGTIEAAQSRVKELSKRKATTAAFYTVNAVPTNFWY